MSELDRRQLLRSAAVSAGSSEHRLARMLADHPDQRRPDPLP
jgi:hypothetical protein